MKNRLDEARKWRSENLLKQRKALAEKLYPSLRNMIFYNDNKNYVASYISLFPKNDSELSKFIKVCPLVFFNDSSISDDKINLSILKKYLLQKNGDDKIETSLLILYTFLYDICIGFKIEDAFNYVVNKWAIYENDETAPKLKDGIKYFGNNKYEQSENDFLSSFFYILSNVKTEEELQNLIVNTKDNNIKTVLAFLYGLAFKKNLPDLSEIDTFSLQIENFEKFCWKELGIEP